MVLYSDAPWKGRGELYNQRVIKIYSDGGGDYIN